MSETVARLLRGDTCVAVGKQTGTGGCRLAHTELTGFVLRSTHFWGMSETVLRPDPDVSLRPTIFIHGNCVPGLDPLIYEPADSEDGEATFALTRGRSSIEFKAVADHELIWSSTGQDDSGVLAEAIAASRSFKVALRLDEDLWIIQRCVLPQFMAEKRYFRLSTPERKIPFFLTWDRGRLEQTIAADGAQLSSTIFQGGVVAFSDGRFIWFNAPKTGAWQTWQELRVFASRARAKEAGGTAWTASRDRP